MHIRHPIRDASVVFMEGRCRDNLHLFCSYPAAWRRSTMASTSGKMQGRAGTPERRINRTFVSVAFINLLVRVLDGGGWVKL